MGFHLPLVNHKRSVKILAVGACPRMVLVALVTERPNCDSLLCTGEGRLQELVSD